MNNLNFQKCLTLLALLIPLTFARAVEPTPDAFVDKFLSIFRPKISKDLDPVILPTADAKFEKNLYLATIEGEAKAYDGRLYGLSSLQRFGRAVVLNAENGTTIDVVLRLKNIDAGYKVSATLLGAGIWLKATVNVSTALIQMKMWQASEKHSHLNLTNFQIEKIGSVSVDIKILGIPGFLDFLNSIFDSIVTFLTNLVKNAIASAIDEPLRKLLAMELAKVSLPDVWS